MKQILFILLLSVSTISSELIAADQKGKFAAKGAARKDCNQFIESANKGNSDYLLFGGWLEGYLSAYNQFQPQNYDIAPWQTTELMLLLLQQHCESNPDIKFLDAVNSLIKGIFPIRLTQESEVMQIDVNGHKSYHYAVIIKKAKERLESLGFYQTGVTEGYSEPDTKAFIAFQTKLGLPVTGIPDQRTLTALFLKRSNKSD